LELRVDDHHLRVDGCASQRTAGEQVESAVESIENHVLDDHRTRVGFGVGGQAIVCCEGDKGSIQQQSSWCVVSSLADFERHTKKIRLAKSEEVVNQTWPLAGDGRLHSH
jgi:hypothetical protein